MFLEPRSGNSQILQLQLQEDLIPLASMCISPHMNIPHKSIYMMRKIPIYIYLKKLKVNKNIVFLSVAE